MIIVDGIVDEPIRLVSIAFANASSIPTISTTSVDHRDQKMLTKFQHL